MKSLPSFPSIDPAGGPPIKILHLTEGDRKMGDFNETRRITCKSDNRSFSLTLVQDSTMDHEFNVLIIIKEKGGHKASAMFEITVHSAEEHGVYCTMTNQFKGAVKENESFWCPSMPDTEILKYSFTDPKLESCFFMNRKNNADLVERITVEHCFSFSQDAVYYVTIKIAAGNKGPCIEVEGPVKRGKDFVEQRFSKLTGKIEREMAQQFLNGLQDNNDLKIVQASHSYVNTGKQSQKGLINFNGIAKGIGNGGLFKGCKFSVKRR